MGDGVASPTGAPGAREAARPRPRGTQIRGGEPPNARTLNAHLQCPLGERQPTRGRPLPALPSPAAAPLHPKVTPSPAFTNGAAPAQRFAFGGTDRPRDGKALGKEKAGRRGRTRRAIEKEAAEARSAPPAGAAPLGAAGKGSRGERGAERLFARRRRGWRALTGGEVRRAARDGLSRSAAPGPNAVT